MQAPEAIVIAGLVAPVCFIIGAISARAFMTTARRDQLDILLSRRLERGEASGPPTRMSSQVDDDAEYSEGFDADDILQASSKAAAIQRATARHVEQKRTAKTLSSVSANPDLVATIVAASRAARNIRGHTPPIRR